MARTRAKKDSAADEQRKYDDIAYVHDVVTMLRVLGGHAYAAGGCPDLNSPLSVLNAFSTGRWVHVPDPVPMPAELTAAVRASRDVLRDLRTHYPLAASMLLDGDDDEGRPLMERLVGLADRADSEGITTLDPCKLGRHYAPSALQCLYWLCASWYFMLKKLDDDDLRWALHAVRLGGAAVDLDRVGARAVHELQRLGPTKRSRKRNSERALDCSAVACVDLFEDPSGSYYRPEWRNQDVAEMLNVPHSALLNKQRDGSWRCPDYQDRRFRHEGKRRFRRPPKG